MVAETELGIKVSADTKPAIRAFQRLSARLKLMRTQAKKLDLQFRGLDRFWSLIAVGSLAAVTTSFFKMAAQIEKTSIQMAAFEGSFSKVPPVLDKIFKLSERVPFSIDSITDVFVRLKASGINPIVDDQGNGPLKNLLDAVAAFGGGPEIFKRAGIAIQQMAGKGVISMEELRQQLGEAVPTAMRVMAEQLNQSVGEMINTISKGELSFEEGFAALNKGFKEKFGGLGEILTDTFSGQLIQVQNNFKKLAATFQRTGGLDIFTSGLFVLNDLLTENTKKFEDNAEAINAGIIEALTKLAPVADATLEILKGIGTILLGVASSITAFLQALPPEIATAGVIGFILGGRLFGFKGAAQIGAAIGIAIAALEKFAPAVSSMIRATIGVIPDEIVGLGLIGFLFFGRLGKIIVFGAGLLALIGPIMLKAGTFMVAMGQVLMERLKKFTKGKSLISLFLLGFDDDLKRDFDKAFEGIGPAIQERAKKLEGEVTASLGNFKKKILSASGLDKDSMETSGKEAGKGFFQGMISQIDVGIRRVQNSRALVEDRIKAIQDRGGLSDKELKTFTKIAAFIQRQEEVIGSVGKQVERVFNITRSQINALDKLIDTKRAQIAKGGTPSFVAGLQDALKDLVKARGQLISNRDKIIGEVAGISLPKLQEQFERTKKSIAALGTSMSPVETAVAKVKSQFAGLRLRLSQIEAGFNKLGPRVKGVKEGLEALEKVRKALNLQETAAITEVTNKTLLKLEKTLTLVQRRIVSLTLNVDRMDLGNQFDEAGIAAARAQASVDRLGLSITKEITKLQALSVNAEASMQSTIANQIEALEKLQIRLGKVSEEFIKRQKFNATEAGKFANSVAASIESSISDSFQAFATGAKSAKEILLDFYASITRAASDYLAKQLLINIGLKGGGSPGGSLAQGIGGFITKGIGAFFGGGGGGGGGAGITGIAANILNGDFAKGADFIVGGSGARDSVPFSGMLTPGERVRIDPPGTSSDGMSINISAMDANSVKNLFVREGSALVSALQARTRLGKGI